MTTEPTRGERDRPVRAEPSRRPRRAPHWSARPEAWGTSPSDAALAVVVTLATVLDFGPGTLGHPLLTPLVALPAFLGLAWRRRYPLHAPVLVCLAALVLSLDSIGEYPPQLTVLAVLVAVYTCAAWTGGRDAVAGGALTLVLVAVAHWVTEDGDVGDFLPFLIWGAAWFAGRLVRRRTAEAAAAALHAAEVQRRREAEIGEATVRERDRIARELHDVVAHAVSMMVVQAGAERLALRGTNPRTVAVLESVESTGRQALTELRTVLELLREPSDPGRLVPQPDLAQLPALVDEVRATGLPVRLRVAGDLATVSPGVALSAYRLVQESLTNVLKHAPGADTSVSVEVSGTVVRVRVENDAAASAVPAGPGRGLVGMRERVALHGGDLTVEADAGRWRVDARMPLAAGVAP